MAAHSAFSSGRAPPLSPDPHPKGETPLHTAVQSHNTVVRELRRPDLLTQRLELLQRKKLHLDGIKILLLMGASAGTKVGPAEREAALAPGWVGGPLLHTRLVCLQDLKSGRSSVHMACEEANVELLSLFLHQPSSASFVNAAVSRSDPAGPPEGRPGVIVTDPLAPSCVSDVQRQHGSARGLRPEGSPGSS